MEVIERIDCQDCNSDDCADCVSRFQTEIERLEKENENLNEELDCHHQHIDIQTTQPSTNPLDVTGWLGSAGHRTIVAKDNRNLKQPSDVCTTCGGSKKIPVKPPCGDGYWGETDCTDCEEKGNE